MGLATAFCSGTSDYYSKTLMKKLDEKFAAWALSAFVFIFNFPFLLVFGIAETDFVFWIAVVSNAAIFSASLYVYMKGIRMAPLSVALPFITLSPVFMILTGFILLGELPTFGGGIGVLLITFGAYVLNASEARNGLLAPLRALKNEPGVKYIIATAAMWSITATIAKIGVVHSNALTYTVADYGAITLVTTLVLLFYDRKAGQKMVGNTRALFKMGVFSALSSLLTMYCLTLTLAVYAIALKRLSSLFTSFYGVFFLGEKHALERLAGAAIMVLGVLAIAFF